MANQISFERLVLKAVTISPTGGFQSLMQYDHLCLDYRLGYKTEPFNNTKLFGYQIQDLENLGPSVFANSRVAILECIAKVSFVTKAIPLGILCFSTADKETIIRNARDSFWMFQRVMESHDIENVVTMFSMPSDIDIVYCDYMIPLRVIKTMETI